MGSKAGRKYLSVFFRDLNKTAYIMKTKRLITAAAVTALSFLYSHALAQSSSGDVYWHIDPGVKTCSMVIDPSLTQDQWKRFTREAGEMVVFKPLAGAEPLGRNHFTLSIEYSVSPIDQHDQAWINTFTHPDEDCPLGDQIVLPIIRGKYGIADKWDVGIMWTSAPQANYGLIGGEVKYAFLDEAGRMPALSAAVSFVSLTGVKDFDMNIGSLGVMAGKRYGGFSPYVGVRESLLMSAETTDKVDLKNENIPATQGFVGLAYTIWHIDLAAEYTLSDIQTFSFLVGYRSARRIGHAAPEAAR